jgi:glycosyltransferase involved in cell wall biosynthesis
MERRPTVSVVLIFHDDERFLPEAIDSVFAQSYTDWELVLVDDGSSDGSTGIAQRLADERADRVRYLDHPGHANRGISATRNLGWRAARGTYVALLDSDDVWEPPKLTEQVAILDQHPSVGLVVGASLYWWSWAGPDAPRDDQLKPIGAAQDRVHHPPSLLPVLYPLGRGVAPCPSSCLVRRDLLERIGGFEERFPGMYEDQAFLVKAYHATDVWVSSRCWDRYRRHAGQLMTTTSREAYHKVRRDFLAWYEDHVEARGLDDPTIQRALRRAWWPYRHPRLDAARRALGRQRARLRQRFGSSAVRR